MGQTAYRPHQVSALLAFAPMPVAPRALNAASILGVLDAAYDVDLDEAAWLAGVCAKLRPLIEEDGAGVHAFTVDLVAGKLGTPLLQGGSPSWERRWMRSWWTPFMLALDARSMQTLFSLASVSYATDLFAAAQAKVPTLSSLLHKSRLFERGVPRLDQRFEYPDSLNLVALDAEGRGLSLVANRTASSRQSPTRAQRSTLGALCGHLASAARLRRKVGNTTALLDGADAILDVRNGKLVHQASDPGGAPGRRVLEEAMPRLAQERRASSRSTGEVGETLSMWRALYAGGFSVLEVFTREGRRYVVARRNQPGRPAASASPLSDRELQVLALVARGHPTSEIAYELGLSISAVSRAVARSGHTLGVEGGDDLIVRARQLLSGGSK